MAKKRLFSYKICTLTRPVPSLLKSNISAAYDDKSINELFKQNVWPNNDLPLYGSYMSNNIIFIVE